MHLPAKAFCVSFASVDTSVACMQAPTVEGMSRSELEGHIGDHVGVSSAVCCAVDYFGPSDFLVMDDQSERDKGHKLIHDGPGEARKATLFVSSLTGLIS